MNSFIVIISFICILIFMFVSFFPCIQDLILANSSKEGLVTSITNIPIPSTGIPDGYYRIDTKNMAVVPTGFSATADKLSIYPTTNTGTIPIPPGGIRDGYYQIDSQNMAIIPYGYKATKDKTQIYPIAKSEIYSNYINRFSDNTIGNNSSITQNADVSNTKYNNDISKLMNVQYHSSEADIRAQEGADSTSQLNNTWITDNSGNRMIYPNMKVQGGITYYTPGAYPFGTANYVPKYDDAVFLSQSTGLNTTMHLKDTAEMMGGFCNYYRHFPHKLEETCRRMDKNACASTNCCVLLGGASCVAGDEKGPTQKSNYSDVFVRNKDFYYYQSKCYGNC